jgi:hypothetical protein
MDLAFRMPVHRSPDRAGHNNSTMDPSIRSAVCLRVQGDRSAVTYIGSRRGEVGQQSELLTLGMHELGKMLGDH